MKKLFALVLFLIAAPALATDYTVTTTTQQDAILDRARLRSNANICTTLRLPSSCTRAQALAVDATIGADYANTISAFINKRMKDVIKAEKAANDSDDTITFEQAYAAANQAAKDAACAAVGLGAGCKP